jgi:hypothetical protein
MVALGAGTDASGLIHSLPSPFRLPGCLLLFVTVLVLGVLEEPGPIVVDQATCRTGAAVIQGFLLE